MAAAALLAAAPANAAPVAAAPADLILRNANIRTVDAARPTARAVAIAGDRIVAVGGEAEVARLRGAATRVEDLHGASVLPGFIDAHTHFGNAVAAFFTARVIDVDSETTLAVRVREAAARVPAGLWITAFDLQGQPAARAAKRRDAGFVPLTPSLATLDSAAGAHPLLVRGYDGRNFVNSAALRLARIDATTPDPPNGTYVHDAAGALTGELRGSAGPRLAAILPPQSRARDLIAARWILRDLAAKGITGIHDIARVEALSQRRIFPVDVERSFTDLSLFEDLRHAGELTARVYAILSLAEWRDYAGLGILPGGGDAWMRYGALKAFVDGSYMRAPYANAPDRHGDFTYRVTDWDAMRADMIGADRLGYDMAVHVIGDRAIDLLLDAYAAATAANGPRDRRFRLIHFWYPAPDQIARAAAMRMIADVTPSQLTDQLGSIDALLGPERAATAFPWASAIRAGMTLDIGSDWPGSYDGASVQPNDPLANIASAMTRGGWHPDQAMTLDQAIRAYTLNPAFAAREEAEKGSITPGKLADLVVLSRDIRRLAPADIARVRVLRTIVGGKTVFRARRPEA